MGLEGLVDSLSPEEEVPMLLLERLEPARRIVGGRQLRRRREVQLAAGREKDVLTLVVLLERPEARGLPLVSAKSLSSEAIIEVQIQLRGRNYPVTAAGRHHVSRTTERIQQGLRKW